MRKNLKRIFTVALAVLTVMVLVSCQSISKPVNTADGKFAGKTVILHSNDVHGAIAKYTYMAGLKEYFQNEGATVLTVDDGDFSQGSVYVSSSKGANAVTVMNAVGYDIAGLGNHEFDYGSEVLKNNLANATFKVICANIYENGKPLFDPYAIYKVGNMKIAFFGMLTPQTMTKVNPGLIRTLQFPEHEEFFAIAKKTAAKLSKSADIVICLGHLGVDDESAEYKSYYLWNAVEGVDFVIDGHSHTVMTSGESGQPIQSTGTKFENIGVIVIDNATKKIEDHYLVPEGDLKEMTSAYVTGFAQEIVDSVDAEYKKTFAESEVELNGDKPANRAAESNNGDLITDAMLWSVKNAGGELNVPAENVLAITNGGGIRAWIHKGPVTKADVTTVLPFGNTIAVVYVTGAELLEALEASTFALPGTEGGFPQIAGMKMTIDTSKPYDKGAQYPESTFYGPKSINRVTIDSINGKPFDAKATYAVVTNNFCQVGGDTYYAFRAAYEAGKTFDTSIAMDVAVMDYVTEILGGKIGAEYAAPQGRITIK